MTSHIALSNQAVRVYCAFFSSLFFIVQYTITVQLNLSIMIVCLIDLVYCPSVGLLHGLYKNDGCQLGIPTEAVEDSQR